MYDHLVVNALVAATLSTRLSLINSISLVWCVQELLLSYGCGRPRNEPKEPTDIMEML